MNESRSSEPDAALNQSSVEVCPAMDELREFLIGSLDVRRQHELEIHIGRCDECCEQLERIEGEPADDTLLSRLRQFDTSVDFSNPEPTDYNAPAIPDELANHPRYEILDHIGTGGMGQVFRARHRIMEKDVAVKIIKRQFMYDENAVKRFQKEIKAAAKLEHKHIVSSIDAEIEHDLNMLVMEFVRGKKLSEYVGPNNPLPIRHSCHFARQVALGLQHAMEKGLTHRDIKPQNLLVVADEGLVKIMDFGLAKFASESVGDDEESLTLEGESFGTPDYVAPEQIRDAKAADIRADIYSLGCTLYFMLTGSKPFPLGSVGEKLAAHLEKHATPIDQLRPEVPRSLCMIIERMMHKDVDSRFQTPAEVAEALTPWSKKNWKDHAAANAVVHSSGAETAPLGGTMTEHPPNLPGSDADAGNLVTAAPGQETWQEDSFAVYDQVSSNMVTDTLDTPDLTPSLPFTSSQYSNRPAAKNSSNRKWIGWTVGGTVAVAAILVLVFSLSMLWNRGDGSSGKQKPLAGGGNPRVLVVIPARNAYFDELEDIQRVAESSGVELVFTSSQTGDIQVIDNQQKVVNQIRVSQTLDAMSANEFDAVVFTGAYTAPGSRQDRPHGNVTDVEFAYEQRWNRTAKQFIDRMFENDRVVASVCGGNAVLIETRTLDGHSAATCKYIPTNDQQAHAGLNVNWKENQNVTTDMRQGKTGKLVTAKEHQGEKFFREVLKLIGN